MASNNRAQRAYFRPLILGGYGVKNVGDEAILAGLLELLPPEARPIVISRDAKETSRMHGVEAIGPSLALPALLRADALIVGGGGLFSSDTGPFGRLIPAYCRLALARGLPVCFESVGVYPSTSAELRRAIASIAPRLWSFSVRDAISQHTLAGDGVTAELVADLSESMPPRDFGEDGHLLRRLGLDLKRPIVGLALTAINPALAEFVATVLPRLVSDVPEVQFCFLPMSQHPSNRKHDDLAFARSLQDRCAALYVMDDWLHPAEMLSIFSRLDAAVCSRFHSFLFASRAGIPIVGLPYSEKCLDWLAHHDLEATPTEVGAFVASVRATLTRVMEEAA